jgi:hypothetical protein
MKHLLRHRKELLPRMNELKLQAKAITVDHQRLLPVARTAGKDMAPRIGHRFQLYIIRMAKVQTNESDPTRSSLGVTAQLRSKLQKEHLAGPVTIRGRRTIHRGGKASTMARTKEIEKPPGKASKHQGTRGMGMIRSKTLQPHHGDRPRSRLAMRYEGPRARWIITVTMATAPTPRTAPAVRMAAHTETNTGPMPSFNTTLRSGRETSAIEPRLVV